MRRIALLGCAAAIALGAAPAGAQQPATVVVIALPVDQAFVLVDGLDVAVGLGVRPPSLDGETFLREIGTLEPGGEPGALRAALDAANVSVFLPPDVPAGHPARALWEVLRLDAPASTGAGGSVIVLMPQDASQAEGVVDGPGIVPLVIGYDDRLPYLVAIPRDRGTVLRGGIARRPAVVTPFDVATTLLDVFGVEGGAGKVLGSSFSYDPFGDVEEIASRLDRDRGYGPGLSRSTVALILGGLVPGFAFARAGRRRGAEALVRAAASVPAGYLVALFVQSPRWQVRAIPMVLAFVAGALVRVPARRYVAYASAGTAAAIAILVVWAALRPGGEPALSLWGNPLTERRFFGLRNHLSSMLGGGALAALALLTARVRVWIAAIAAVVVVTGAPMLGANFIAVLTIGFGGALAILYLRREAPSFADAVVSFGIAGLAMGVALLTDVGAGLSHGGRATGDVIDRGPGAAWDIYLDRLRINIDSIADVGVVGWAGLAGLLAGLAVLIRWAARERDLDVPVRAGIVGGCAAALAAVVLEDTGFLTGGTLAAFPGFVALAERATRDGPRSA